MTTSRRPRSLALALGLVLSSVLLAPPGWAASTTPSDAAGQAVSGTAVSESAVSDTVIAVSVSPTRVQEGGAVTVTATVRTTSGAPVTSGTVNISAGYGYECNSATSSLNSSGVATGAVKMVALEDPTVYVAYLGDAAFAPSEAWADVVVDPVVLPTAFDFTAASYGDTLELEPLPTYSAHWGCGYYDQDADGPVDYFVGTRLIGSGTGYTGSEGDGIPAPVSLAPGTHQVRAVWTPQPVMAFGGDAPGFASSSTTKIVTVAADGRAATTPELVRNPSFEASAEGWASTNGRVTRAAAAGAPDGSAVARVARTAGTSYTLTDTATGLAPTVTATTAGATYVASAHLATASGATAGRPVALVLQERTPAGALVRETRTASKLGTAWKRVAVAATAKATGNTLGLRVEQTGAVTGDAFVADRLTVRHASRLQGPGVLTSYRTGTVWTSLTGNAKRASQVTVTGAPLDLASIMAHVDGKGASAGSQTVKGVVYADAGGAPGALLATTAGVTVKAGQAGRNVVLPLKAPVALAPGTYWVGLHSGATASVARYLATDAPAALRTNLDAYSDGAAKTFGSATQGDKRMVLWLSGG